MSTEGVAHKALMPSGLGTVVRCCRRYIPISGGNYAGSLALRKSRSVTRDLRSPRGLLRGVGWGDLLLTPVGLMNLCFTMRTVANFLTMIQARQTGFFVSNSWTL